MHEQPHAPPQHLSDPAELFRGYLAFYRTAALRKLDGPSDEQLRSSRLPSGWTPLELLKHLAYMERRWFRWGFAGEPVDAPWGDRGPDGRWAVEPTETVADIKAILAAEAEHTDRILASTPLGELAAAGGRFDADDRATLAWIAFHVLQEYARHVGHLDIARELIDGSTGL